MRPSSGIACLSDRGKKKLVLLAFDGAFAVARGNRKAAKMGSLPCERAIKFKELAYNQPVLTAEDKQWILEGLEKLETTLLTEFHKWASPLEMRQKSHAAAIRALDIEVESVSDRVNKLEGR